MMHLHVHRCYGCPSLPVHLVFGRIWTSRRLSSTSSCLAGQSALDLETSRGSHFGDSGGATGSAAEEMRGCAIPARYRLRGNTSSPPSSCLSLLSILIAYASFPWLPVWCLDEYLVARMINQTTRTPEAVKQARFLQHTFGRKEFQVPQALQMVLHRATSARQKRPVYWLVWQDAALLPPQRKREAVP